MTGNLADFARFLGVHKSSVTRAVQAGRIVREADGSIDFEKGRAAWHATSGGRADVSARHAAQRGSAIPTDHPEQKNQPAPHVGPAPADIGGVDTAGDSKRSAKTALMHYENSQLKLDMALRRGMRFELSAVKREGAALGSILRAGIDRVIDQTAPRLAAAGSDLDRRRILDGEIRRLRWVIKRELPRALRRIKAAGEKVGAGGTAE